MNPLVAAARRMSYLAWHRRVRAGFERTDACRLLGLDLLIAPGVLHPRHFASSLLLARYLAGLSLRGASVADVGTGSGLLGLVAAREGATVVAVDIDPVAVACALGNARRNGLEERMSVLESDVFDRVSTGLRFDLVVTNPPFYPRAPERPLDRAFAAGAGNEFFSKLAESLPHRLADQGALVLIQSSDVDFAPIAGMLESRGLTERVVLERRGLFETLTIREFRTRSRGSQTKDRPGARGGDPERTGP